MGGTSSKAARKFPARPPPSWAGARTNLEARPSPRNPSLTAQNNKSPLIIEDSKDPHLVSSLHQLGQVNVHRVEVGQNDLPTQSRITPQPSSSSTVSKMFESRLASEAQASSFARIPNRTSAAALSDLLDARKEVTSRKELEQLAKEYGIDVGLLEKVSRVVNSPSVGERTTVRAVENGEEKVTSKALWVNPPL